MVELKTDKALEAMREAGRVVAHALAAVRAAAAVGVRLHELDEAARAVLDAAGARSPFLGYRPAFAPVPFPAVICASVNDAVAHGVPDGYRLRDGDLVSIDCGATLDGWTGDAAISFTVGTPRPEDEALIKVGYEALAAGIGAAVAGNRIGDISAAIAAVGRGGGIGISTDYGGHGVGHQMHESPSVPNEGRAGRGMRLEPGLTIAIEPWFMGGGDDRYRVDRDGWTIRSVDGSRCVHVENTIAVTEDGPVVLTAL